MATVYVATDLRLERRIALKVMHGHLSDDTVFQGRFIQEARAAARLADPHVVNVFDQGQDGEMAYLVMEYLPGITLRELMREQRRLTIPQTITIMDAVLSGLAAAHRAGIVHRDVKPENVLLAEDGRIKIGDFGLARATTANTATGAQLLGTIAYLAPELVTRGTADARSDIYALGIMLYEMLVGEQPYKGEQPMQIAFQHATDSVPRPSAKNPSVPEPLDELVLWATEKVPDERPDDAQQMLERLREIERELGVTPMVARAVATTGIPTVEEGGSGDLTAVLPGTVTGTTGPVDDVDNATRLRRRTKRRKTRGGWLFALVILLAALAGGAGWWFGSGPGSLVVVADVSTLTIEQATQRLADDALVAVPDTAYSLDVPAGQVINTDPAAGDRVDKDTEVRVYVSAGPQPVTVEALGGLSAEQARGVLAGSVIDVGDDVREFSADVPEGSVISASVLPAGTETPIDCTPGCDAHQGDAATLVVSVGPVPDVAGKSVETATADLKAKELEVSPDIPQEFSNDIDEGTVIRIAPRDSGSWRPGDTVTLIVSKGPEPVEVPNVAGRGLGEAVQMLEDAGFQPTTNVPEFVWGLFTATGTTPEAGTLQRPGTKIQIHASG